MIAAEDARDWLVCAYDILDRTPGFDARIARDRVWEISDAIEDGADCTRACADALEILREFITTDRLAWAIADVMAAYVADDVADDLGLRTPADCVRYARDVLTLPGHHVIGGWPIAYEDISDIPFIMVVAATDAQIADALTN